MQKIKNWWNNPCFWSHKYIIIASEQRALAYKCENCDKIKLQTF